VAEVKTIPIQDIAEAVNLLRPVRQETVAFTELANSIRDHGLLKPVLVRPNPRADGYQVVDGMHRFTACKYLHMSEVPCVVRELNDLEVLQIQITANANHVETSDVEFARQMDRLVRKYEAIGQSIGTGTVAKMVGKSTTWVRDRLNLLVLPDKYLNALDSGAIRLGHALELARIKHVVQRKRLFEFAQEHTVRETQLEAGRILRDYRAENGELLRKEQQTLVPRYRPLTEALEELESLEKTAGIILRDNLTTPLQGAKAALEWMLGLDEQTRALKVRNWEDRITREQRRDYLVRQRYKELEELEQIQKDRESRKSENH